MPWPADGAQGGPLDCTGVDQLSPSEAGCWLADHGYEVSWQIEDRTAGTTTTSDQPPDRGGIIDALALGERSLLVLVDLGRTEPHAMRPCPRRSTTLRHDPPGPSPGAGRISFF